MTKLDFLGNELLDTKEVRARVERNYAEVEWISYWQSILGVERVEKIAAKAFRDMTI